MSQTFPLKNFKWTKWRFHKKHDEESDEGYFFEVDVQYLEKLHERHKDLPFLPERMKTEEVQNLAVNFSDITEYVIHIENWKQALNYGLVF